MNDKAFVLDSKKADKFFENKHFTSTDVINRSEKFDKRTTKGN